MLSLGSTELSEQEINDLGNSFIRTQLVAVQGGGSPSVWWQVACREHRSRSDALYARGLSPDEINTAILSQNTSARPAR